MATRVPVPRPRAAPRQLKPPVPKPRILKEDADSSSSGNKLSVLVEEVRVPSPRIDASPTEFPPERSQSVPPAEKTVPEQPKRRVTNSLLFDFDPLLSSSSNLVEEVINADYEPINLEREEHIYDPVAEEEEPSSEEDAEPPPPPPRQDSIPREMWDQIPAARLGNSNTAPEPPMRQLPEAAKRVTHVNRAVRGLRSLIGEAANRGSTGAATPATLRPMGGERGVHDGRLTLGSRDKQRSLVRLSTKSLSWLPDGAKKWNHVYLENCVQVIATISQSLRGFDLITLEEGTCVCTQAWAQTEEERNLWLCKVLEALTDEASLHEACCRLGWLHLKEGVGGVWRPSWLSLRERRLCYLVPGQELQTVDLRKAKCFEKEGDQEGALPGQPMFVVQVDSLSLYLQGVVPRVTEQWRLAVRGAILRNGFRLKEQQLTSANVVLLVDLCTNFVITNGIMSEGVYRKAGQISKVTALLEALQKDPREVALTCSEYSEHDVCSALKRFFVKLPEPVLPPELVKRLADCATSAEKGRLLRRKLDAVTLATLAKLFGHLHLIARESAWNKMDARNLATVWSVGLTHITDQILDADITTLSGIISNYPEIFGVDAAVMKREQKLVEMLERLQSAPPQNTSAGDLRIWLTIGEANSSETMQITLTPQKTAADVVAEASEAGARAHGRAWHLREVVGGGALWRPLHPTERVMEAVARWGYWSEADRADNRLVLGQCNFLEELRPLAVPPATACGRLRLATPAARAYKERFVQLQQGSVVASKLRPNNQTNKLMEWVATEHVWYIGFDSKRGPTSDRRWYLTLVPKSGAKAARSKDSPFFGTTIAFEQRQELLEWCASLLLNEHPGGVN